MKKRWAPCNKRHLLSSNEVLLSNPRNFTQKLPRQIVCHHYLLHLLHPSEKILPCLSDCFAVWILPLLIRRTAVVFFRHGSRKEDPALIKVTREESTAEKRSGSCGWTVHVGRLGTRYSTKVVSSGARHKFCLFDGLLSYFVTENVPVGPNKKVSSFKSNLISLSFQVRISIPHISLIAHCALYRCRWFRKGGGKSPER